MFEAFVFGTSSVDEDESATGKDTECSEIENKTSRPKKEDKAKVTAEQESSSSSKATKKELSETDKKTSSQSESDVTKKEENIPTSVSGDSSVEYSSVQQPRVYVRSGVHYFNAPPPDSPQPQNYNPNSVPFAGNPLAVQGLFQNPYYYQPTVQYIPPLPNYPINTGQHGMIPLDAQGLNTNQQGFMSSGNSTVFSNQQGSYIQLPNSSIIPNTQPYFVTPTNQGQSMLGVQGINPYGTGSNQASGQNINIPSNQSAEKEDEKKKSEDKNKKQAKKNQSSTSKKEYTSKSESSDTEGIFPIFVPTKQGLIPRYVSSKGMNLIDKISEEYCKSPDTSTGISTDQDQTQSSDNSTSRRRTRRPFYIEKYTSSESEHSSKKKGTPWPYIHINKKKGKGKNTAKKSIYVIPTKMVDPPKNIKEKSKQEEELQRSETYLGKKGSRISFESIDNENKSRPTSTEAIDKMSEDAMSHQLGSLSISDDKSENTSLQTFPGDQSEREFQGDSQEMESREMHMVPEEDNETENLGDVDFEKSKEER